MPGFPWLVEKKLFIAIPNPCLSVAEITGEHRFSRQFTDLSKLVIKP
jgi:hypothetical protein